MDLTLILEPKPAGPEMISQWRDLPPELVDRLPEFISFPGARTLRSVSQHWLMMLSLDEPSANPDVLDKDSVVECVCVFGDVGDMKCRLPPDLVVRTHHIVFPPGHDNLSVFSTSGGLICFGERHAESGRPPTLLCNAATEMWRELPKGCLNEDEEEEEVHDVVCWFLVVDEVANFYAVWGADDFCDNCNLYDSREMCWWRVRGGPDSDA